MELDWTACDWGAGLFGLVVDGDEEDKVCLWRGFDGVELRTDDDDDDDDDCDDDCDCCSMVMRVWRIERESGLKFNLASFGNERSIDNHLHNSTNHYTNFKGT